MAQHAQTKEQVGTGLSQQTPAATPEPEVGSGSSTEPQTLPKLLGEVATFVLTALQSGKTPQIQHAVGDSTRRLRIWYDAQPVEGRKEAAAACRKMTEQFRQVAEQMHQEMLAISTGDIVSL